MPDRCKACGDWRQIERDHIRPLAQGGTDLPTNIQSLCRRCNRLKGAWFLTAEQIADFLRRKTKISRWKIKLARLRREVRKYEEIDRNSN